MTCKYILCLQKTGHIFSSYRCTAEYKGQTFLSYKYGISQSKCCISICKRISWLMFLQIGFSVDGTRDIIIDEHRTFAL